MPTDLIGTIHGQLKVISRHSVANKKVHWNVECLSCTKRYHVAADSLRKNTLGCADCARVNAPKGNKSIYWRGGRHISSIFLSNVKRGARKRNIECHVTLEDLDALWEKQNGRCAYTNRELILGHECTASLDRIDSSIGYQTGNIQFLHKDVNVSKWAMSEDDFFGMIREIYEFRSNNVCQALHKEQLPGVPSN